MDASRPIDTYQAEQQHAGINLDADGGGNIQMNDDQSVEWKSKYLLGLVAVAATAAIALNSDAGSNVFRQVKTTSLSESSMPLPYDGVYTVYKHTSSVSTGSVAEVSAFFNTYISPGTVENYDLGCGLTTKSVAKMSPPAAFDTAYDSIAFDEVHFVDSSVFPTSGSSISEWAQQIEGLGTTNFNAFMHNKLQMYVPDLSKHYSLLMGDGIKVILRASSSDGTGVLDTAHIGVPVAAASVIYEIVGPLSSLSDLSSDELAAFARFAPNECPLAQTLAQPLSYYEALFNTATGTMSSNGFYIPMGIATTVPTQSLEYIAPTANLVTSITGFEQVVTSSDDGSCDVMSIDFTSEAAFGPVFRYVVNSNAPYLTSSEDGTFSATTTVQEWESQIDQTHADILDNSATYMAWDRYLDTHMGVAYSSIGTDDQVCDEAEAMVAALAESQMSYSYRVSHYYVGTGGLRSWEFHQVPNFCGNKVPTPLFTDICGCIADNNEAEYFEINSVDACPKVDSWQP